MKTLRDTIHELHLLAGGRRTHDLVTVDRAKLLELLAAVPDYPYVRLEAGEIVRLTNYYWTQERHTCGPGMPAGHGMPAGGAPGPEQACAVPLAMAGTAAD